MDQLVEFLNAAGRAFSQYAGAMFIQTAVLVAALLVVDLLVRKRAGGVSLLDVDARVRQVGAAADVGAADRCRLLVGLGNTC